MNSLNKWSVVSGRWSEISFSWPPTTDHWPLIKIMAQKNQTFESSLGELEKIVRKLEDGDLSLEESLKLFEDGVRISRECQERLSQAERRIEILLKDEKGSPILQEINSDTLDEPPQPKIKRRIVFDEEQDESPF